MTNALQPGTTEEIAVDRATKTEEKITKNTGSLGSGFAICVVGYPGAGKSTAAEEVYDIFTDYFDADILCVDIEEFSSESDVDSIEARPFVGQIDKEYKLVDHEGAVFDGVESLRQVEYISKFFDSISILYIVSHHAVRHARLIEDARSNNDNLDNFSHDSLRKRDNKAATRGLNDFEEAQFYDMELTNEDISESEFRRYAEYAAEDLVVDYETRK